MSSLIEVQFDFFKTKEECEIEQLKKLYNETKASTEKVRKSLFARNNELNKKMTDLEQRLEILERNICKS